MFALLPAAHLTAIAPTVEEEPAITPLERPRDEAQPAAPAWIKDLILYEVATKGFTSPRGPESGTFASLKEKLPYLQTLGITGIWLAGYSLCDPNHFYNIWTQYAVIEPDKLDPSLGTKQEFKSLVDTAHSRGIKVILDVITHGLMKDCPLVRQHPSWFRGGSWGMADFDWTGGHTDLDDWWVKIYTGFVVECGIDGYRLDVNIYRPDLWERIRRNAAAAGHPIVIFEEINPAIPGVTDFSQRENMICASESGLMNEILLDDIPGFFAHKFGRSGFYEVEIRYRDGEMHKGNTKGEGPIEVHLDGLVPGRASRKVGEDFGKPDGLPNVHLTLDHIERKPIANLTIHNEAGEQWQLRSEAWGAHPLFIDVPEEALYTGILGPKAEACIATLVWGSSVQLSCHDNGWAGFPLDKNPYVAQGSRSIFGYSFLLSPMIPIFFSGEEFNAGYHPLPTLSPSLYGGKDAGKGRWLYGSMLDWNELQEPGHKAMLADVQKMISIRRQHSGILAMTPGGDAPNLRAVPCECAAKIPVPYLRWNDRAAIVVAANRNRDQDAAIELVIDLAGTSIDGHERYIVTDLWSGAAARTHSAADIKSFAIRVQRDGNTGGGLAVFKIEPTA